MKQIRVRTILTFLTLLTLITGGSCVQLPRNDIPPPDVRRTEALVQVNINTASAQELEQLPGVGKVIAERIVAYREQYGRFRRPEELLMINGVSDKKFRAIQAIIVVE